MSHFDYSNTTILISSHQDGEAIEPNRLNAADTWAQGDDVTEAKTRKSSIFYQLFSNRLLIFNAIILCVLVKIDSHKFAVIEDNFITIMARAATIDDDELLGLQNQ